MCYSTSQVFAKTHGVQIERRLTPTANTTPVQDAGKIRCFPPSSSKPETALQLQTVDKLIFDSANGSRRCRQLVTCQPLCRAPTNSASCLSVGIRMTSQGSIKKRTVVRRPLLISRYLSHRHLDSRRLMRDANRLFFVGGRKHSGSCWLFV